MNEDIGMHAKEDLVHIEYKMEVLEILLAAATYQQRAEKLSSQAFTIPSVSREKAHSVTFWAWRALVALQSGALGVFDKRTWIVVAEFPENSVFGWF